ncbi:MAG: hypothetical protein GX222_04865 [Ruminococcaceae bacterium]|nr:hypothetical protein [Oscillospiraceae bacterium]
MKKILALLMIFAVLISFSACGESDLTDESLPDAGGLILNAGEKPTQTPPETVYTISDEPLAENEYLTATLSEVYENVNGDIILRLILENKTDDVMDFYFDSASCNGYMLDTDWRLELDAGKTARSLITFSAEDLEMAGIETAEEISFEFGAYHFLDNIDYLIKDITIYPTGLDEDSVTYPERPPAKGEYILFESDDLKVSIEDVDEDGEDGYNLYMYAENKSDKDIYIYTYSVSVNGYMMDSGWYQWILSGKKAAKCMTISNYGLDLSGIEKVGEIEFGMSAYEDEGDTLFDETLTINPEIIG